MVINTKGVSNFQLWSMCSVWQDDGFGNSIFLSEDTFWFYDFISEDLH